MPLSTTTWLGWRMPPLCLQIGTSSDEIDIAHGLCSAAGPLSPVAKLCTGFHLEFSHKESLPACVCDLSHLLEKNSIIRYIISGQMPKDQSSNLNALTLSRLATDTRRNS